MAFLKKSAYRFRVNGRNGGFQFTMMPYIVFPLFWCFRVDGRKRFEYAKEFYVNTVRLEKHTLLCHTWQSTRIFKYIFKGHCRDYAHARRTFIFFPQKDLSRFSRSLGRLATLKASSTRLTAFVKVNSSQRSICGTSQHLSSL